ncbi:MAG: hypothetical protein HY906_02840 [Deltaproteobacteria bacterium]|nr:hypothetical protein [Deltaproteobacteria bacterium]
MALIAGAAVLQATVARAQSYVIPPGQEALLAEMLGREAALPDGCRWARASIDLSVATSHYLCGSPARAVSLILRHQQAPVAAGVATRHFVIGRGEGSPPDALLAAVAERVRANEGRWRWAKVTEPPPVRLRPGQSVLAWFARWDVAVPALAWLVLLAWLAANARRLVAARRDALVAAACFVVAAAVGLAVPWGPLDFAEPERLQALWSTSPDLQEDFVAITLPLQLLQAAGVPGGALVRVIGPLWGALSVTVTYLLARSLGAGRLPSLVAAAAVCLLPAHLRYSGTVPFTIAGGALLAGACAVACSRFSPWRKLPFVAAATVLAGYARPELVLTAAPLSLLVLADGPWAVRAAWVALLLVALGPHAWDVGFHRTRPEFTGGWGEFAVASLWGARLGAGALLAVGAVGLLAGRARWLHRAALASAVAVLAWAYARTIMEENPLWGHWRYVLSGVPLLAVGLALLLERVTNARAKRIAAATAAAVLVGALWLAREAVTRPIDIQVDFQYARASVGNVVSRYRHVAVVTSDDLTGSARRSMMDATSLMAFGLRLGPLARPVECRAQPLQAGVQVWSLRALLTRCPEAPSLAAAAVYLGAYRPEAELAALRGRFTLVPIEERMVSAAPVAQRFDTQCPRLPFRFVGGRLQDCPLRLGWYRLAPAPLPSSAPARE